MKEIKSTVFTVLVRPDYAKEEGAFAKDRLPKVSK
jgi:hypothetical protein